MTPRPPMMPHLEYQTKNMPPTLEIHQNSWHDRTLKAMDHQGSPMAEMSCPLFAFGSWDIKFPVDNPYSNHNINMKPMGPGSRADIFVKGSTPYFWDRDAMEGGGEGARLFKAINGMKSEVGRYVKQNSRKRGCVLSVNEGEIDAVLAVLTCVAGIKTLASFRK